MTSPHKPVLLDEVVAGEPREVIPIAQLPLEVGLAGVAGAGELGGERACVVGGDDGADVADGAGVNFGDGLAHA